jgi:hypothetical protein
MRTKDEEGLQAFLAEATTAYQQMFAAERQTELKTFSQREVRVYEEGRRLSRWLLEKHLEQDRDSQPAADTLPCPGCQRPSARVGHEREVRPVTTLVGDITFPRAKYRCRHCRKSFFPSRLRLGIAEQPAQPGSAQARR